MGLFGFKKDKEKSAAKDKIDLKKVLDAQEIRLLSTDLRVTGDKMPASKQIFEATAQLVEKNGVIPKQGLDLCIASVQNVVDSMASAFGFMLGGNSALLDKLKALKEKEG